MWNEGSSIFLSSLDQHDGERSEVNGVQHQGVSVRYRSHGVSFQFTRPPVTMDNARIIIKDGTG
jgi:hypothetical protein